MNSTRPRSKRSKVNDRSGSVAPEDFPQALFVGEVADFESPPLGRFRIAARKIVIADGIESGAVQSLTGVATDVAGTAGD